VRQLESNDPVLFEELLVQEFSARVGGKGHDQGGGGWGLTEGHSSAQFPWLWRSAGPASVVPRLEATSMASLGIGRQPAQALAGRASCKVRQGKHFNAQAWWPGPPAIAMAMVEPVAGLQQRWQEKWDFPNGPWCLFGPEVGKTDGWRCGSAIPNFLCALNDLGSASAPICWWFAPPVATFKNVRIAPPSTDPIGQEPSRPGAWWGC